MMRLSRVAMLLVAGCSTITGPAGVTHPVGVVVGTPLVASRPFAVAISLNGIAYVGRQDVPFLQVTTLPATTFGDSVQVGSDPTDIAFNLPGTAAYVTNQFSGNVGIVNVASGLSTDNISLPGSPFRILAAPNTAEVFVSSNNDSVYAIALPSKTVVHRWGLDAGPDARHRRRTATDCV